MSMSYFEDLRKTAEQLYLSNKKDNQLVIDKNASELVEDLSIQHIELELQKETLQQTQNELLELYNKYQTLYKFSPVAFITIDQKGLILDINKAGEDLLGIKAESLIKKSFTRYLAPNYQLAFASYKKSLIQNNFCHPWEVKLHRKNGTAIFGLLDSKLIVNPQRNESEILICITNVTNQKQDDINSQQQFLKIIKNDRISMNIELSTMIINELNNPLAVIVNYLNGCLRRIETKNYKVEDLLYGIKQALIQTNRASELILRMKDLNYKGQLHCEPIDLDVLMSETIKLIPYEIGDLAINIQYRPSSNLPLVTADKIQIQQVILNLLRNAIEAMIDHHTREPAITIYIHAGQKNKLEVEISDNGPGISPSVRQKLFSPNFTTKSYGIGLGLITCRSIIEAHGGEIKLSSNINGGVCVTFTLTVA